MKIHELLDLRARKCYWNASLFLSGKPSGNEYQQHAPDQFRIFGRNANTLSLKQINTKHFIFETNQHKTDAMIRRHFSYYLHNTVSSPDLYPSVTYHHLQSVQHKRGCRSPMLVSQMATYVPNTGNNCIPKGFPKVVVCPMDSYKDLVECLDCFLSRLKCSGLSWKIYLAMIRKRCSPVLNVPALSISPYWLWGCMRCHNLSWI